MVPN
jgi:acetyl-CoA acyltransferase 1